LRDRDTSEPPDGVLNERLYAIQDPNWNVTTIIDDSGDVQERYEYQAYGRPAFLDNNWDQRAETVFQWCILYAGYHHETPSGLYLVRHRSLHSILGQWMQRDPLEYTDGISTYQYALSAPSSRFDPHGLEVFEIPDTEEGTTYKGTITITVSSSNLCSCIADKQQRGPVTIRSEITIAISAAGLDIQRYADQGVAVIDGTEAKFMAKRIGRKLAIVATHYIERPPCPRGIQQGTHLVGLVYDKRKGQRTFTNDGKEARTTGVIQLYQVKWTYYCIDTGTDCLEAIPFTATVVNTRPGKDQIFDDVTEGNLPIPSRP